MSDEEWDKKVEFILTQQAQFSADIGQLKDSMSRFENLVTRFATAAVGRFGALETGAAERFGDVDAKIAALVDSQIRTEGIAKENTENIRHLTAVVDRYFAGRNGGTKDDG